MKSIMKKWLAVFMISLLVISVVPVGTFALAESDTGSNASGQSFNPFLDAGPITDAFVDATTQLISENWSDDYFSSISMNMGESSMYIDGEEVDLSIAAATDDEGVLVLPLMELAEAVGATAEINQHTGDILIETPEIQTSRDALANELAEGNTAQAADPETDVKDIVIEDNHTVTMYMNDGTVVTKLPAIQEAQAEELFLLDISVQNDHILITKPYQTKEIVLYVREGKALADTHQATDVVTNQHGLYFLQYASEAQTQAAYEAFSNDDAIEYLVLNEVVSAAALPSPGSWGTNGNEYSMGIQADRLKTYLQNSSQETVVAVVDSGVDAEYLPEDTDGREGHPHLEGRTTVPASAMDDTAGYNYVDNNNNPYDGSGHGTHVAGTIVDCTPDNVTIMPVKVLGDSGTGTMLNVSYGITYAAQHGADVINLSLGGNCAPDCSIEAAIDAIIETAAQEGTDCPMIIAAAGNDTCEITTACPARLSAQYDNVVTVAAVDQNDMIAGFSNYGAAIDVCAPGVNIYSSIPGGGYGYKSGTSMATPHVSAAMAMLAMIYPDYTPAQLKAALKSMVVDLGVPGEDTIYGAGRIDCRMLSTTGLPAVSPVAATSLSVKQMLLNGSVIPCNTVELSYGAAAEDYRFVSVVSPKDCTDKSVIVYSSNADVVSCQNGIVHASGIGNATLTFSKTNVTSLQIPVNVLDSWINHAAASYGGGTGTQTDPYLIGTAAQLAKLAYETRVNRNRYHGKYFKLTSDIDLSGYTWDPIGSIDYARLALADTASFQGSFDGNGYAVSNMTVSVPQHRQWEFLGLFGYIRGSSDEHPAIIKNLAVINADVSAVSDSQDHNTGILCGVAITTDISNCYTQGVTTGSGLVGFITVSANVRNCYADAQTGTAGLVADHCSSHIYNSYACGTTGNVGLIKLQYLSGGVVNSFFVPTGTDTSSHPFMYKKSDDGDITKCYYPTGCTGVTVDSNPSSTDLTAKPVSFFTTRANFTNTANWDSTSPWDFDTVWNVDSNYQGGLPYLRTFQRLCGTQAMESLSFSSDSIEIKAGATKQLSVNISPSDTTNKALLWNSSAPGTVSVNANGIITAIASSGSAAITASAVDGSGKTATCTVYIDDHMSVFDEATAIGVNNSIGGVINYADDTDYFAFTPTDSATYIFYSTGSTDVDGALYSSSGSVVLQNANKSSTDLNFAITYGSLIVGNTYYIGVKKSDSGSLGNYTVNVAKAYGNYHVVNSNADARKVEFYVEAANVVDSIRLTFGSKSYTLAKPTGTTSTVTTNGGTFKITLTTLNNGFTKGWSIKANLPATTVGSSSAARFSLRTGGLTAVSSLRIAGIIAYGASYKTNLTPNTYVSALLSSMATTGYTFTAYDWNNAKITATTTTKVATGTKIVQKNSSGKIVHVYYLVLFGDVAGSGVVGDGLINAVDSMQVLQEVESSFLGAISRLAADANHDTMITSADSDLILSHAVGNATINQNVAISGPVDSSCYFGSSVAF